MKKPITTAFISFFVLYGSASLGGPAKTNRALTRSGAISATIGRSLEIDPCSSRNIAANINAFWSCVKGKLKNYTVSSGAGGATQWDPSKIWAMSKGSVQTTTIPTMTVNRSLFNQWKSLYERYKKIKNDNDILIGQLDAMAETENDDDNPSDELEKLQQQQLSIQSQLNNMVRSWASFLKSNEQYFKKANTALPTTIYPTSPDPRSNVFLTESTRSGVYMIDEKFYADLRNLLDKNPNMHLQLMKYYLISRTPANFRKLTTSQKNDAINNKMFRISLWCADPKGIEGALLSIAAGAAPPLAFLPLDACQFNAARVGVGDGSPISTTGGNNGYA
jgi:hypothetical protein